MRREAFVVLIHVFVGWVFCLGILFLNIPYLNGFSREFLLIIISPIVFLLISNLYFNRFYYTSPLATALIFAFTFWFFDRAIGSMLLGSSLGLERSPITIMILGMVFLVTLLIGEKHKWEVISKHGYDWH